MTYKVREATEEDRTDILVLAKQFVKEAPEIYSWNSERMERDVDNILTDPNYGVLLLEYKGESVGLLAFTASEMPFTGKVIGFELAWFLEEEHRKGRTALMLVREYERVLTEAGVGIAALSDIQGLRSLESLYNKLGYERMETMYIRSL